MYVLHLGNEPARPLCVIEQANVTQSLQAQWIVISAAHPHQKRDSLGAVACSDVLG